MIDEAAMSPVMQRVMTFLKPGLASVLLILILGVAYLGHFIRWNIKNFSMLFPCPLKHF